MEDTERIFQFLCKFAETQPFTVDEAVQGLLCIKPYSDFFSESLISFTLGLLLGSGYLELVSQDRDRGVYTVKITDVGYWTRIKEIPVDLAKGPQYD